MVLSKCNLKKKKQRTKTKQQSVNDKLQTGALVLLSWCVFILTDILQKDLNSR